MFITYFSSSTKSTKLIGIGALVIGAIGVLVYSLSTYGKGDSITPVTENASGATMRKLTCSKCGYEEEVTSAVYNERMKDRADPTQWLECPKCHENAVRRANDGIPSVAAQQVDMPAETKSTEQSPPDESAPIKPVAGPRGMKPGA